jgi:hypothetical protein
MAKRTIRRRLRKSRTIRKVMRGCNGRSRGRRGRAKIGGEAGMVQATTFSGAGTTTNANNIAMQKAAMQAGADAKAQQVGPPEAPIKSNMVGGVTTTTTKEPFGVGDAIHSNPAQVGGRGSYRRGVAKTRHHKRKLRYKKSIARKSRHA